MRGRGISKPSSDRHGKSPKSEVIRSRRLKTNVQKIITLDQNEVLNFCGQGDSKLKKMQSRVKAKIVARGNELRLSGQAEEVDKAYHLISELLQVQRTSKSTLTDQQIRVATENFDDHPPEV